jgi:subtilisin family serine protease
VRPRRHNSSVILSSQFSVTGIQPLAVQNALHPLDLVKLTPLMQIASGRAETRIALIDGPVATNHPELSGTKILELPGKIGGTCQRATSLACMHGTFVAGILSAKRGSVAPAICPDCTLIIRPIFAETTLANGQMPSATPEELAAAVIDCIDAGAHVINLSAALANPSAKGERRLEEALGYCARRGVIIVAAAGNQAAVGSSAITHHPWVIPVIASDLRGRPISYSNLGSSIGRQGLSAPGESIRSIAINGQSPAFGGTSAAAPFVTGAIALLLSIFPNATAAAVKLAITTTSGARRTTVVPPLLNAWAAYEALLTTHSTR